MGYTKRQFITAAYEEIGLADYVFDLRPEDLQSAMRKLDAMMAEWNAKGIRVGYPIGSNPSGGNLDEETTVPDVAYQAIATNLALRLAPAVGKNSSNDTRINAKTSYNTLLSFLSTPIPYQFPSTLPSGAGNKRYGTGRNFVNPPTDVLEVGKDDVLEL